MINIAPELLNMSVGALGMLVALAAISLAGKALDSRRRRKESERPDPWSDRP